MKRIKLINNIKELTKNKSFWFCFIFLIIGVILNQLSSLYIRNEYGDTLPILHDLLLDVLPYYHIFWVFDLFALIAVVVFVYYGLSKKPESMPYFLLLIGIMQWLRTMFVVLTPFGHPNGSQEGILIGSAFRYGVYFSGHTGNTFLSFLLVEGRLWKWIFGVLTFLVVLFLLLGRGHYSVDIFTALIFVVAIWLVGERYLKKKFV